MDPQDLPWASWARNMSPQDTPRAPPNAPEHLSGPLKSKGRHASNSRTEHFGPPGPLENQSRAIFRPSETPPRPPRASALIVRVAPGNPKGRLGAPREPPRTPKDGPERSQDPLRMPLRPPLERFHEIHVKKDPSRPPRCPPRCPWRSPSASNIVSEDVFHRFFQELLCFCLFVC